MPGGAGVTDQAIGDQAFLAELRRLAATARFTTSVCTGSLALAAAGLLRGKRAACHWAVARSAGAVRGDRRFRPGGARRFNVITGGGVTAGIDFALDRGGRTDGRAAAQAIQLQIEYAPAPPFEAGRPETAPPAVVARVRERGAAMAAARRQAVEAAARAL